MTSSVPPPASASAPGRQHDPVHQLGRLQPHLDLDLGKTDEVAHQPAPYNRRHHDHPGPADAACRIMPDDVAAGQDFPRVLLQFGNQRMERCFQPQPGGADVMVFGNRLGTGAA